MKKILFLGVILLVLAGCKSPIPEDIIQPDKMGKVLYDIHLVDAYISTMPDQDSAKRVAAAYYKGIYQKFAIDSLTYQQSMDFYYNNPEIMAQLYDQIKGKLTDAKIKTEKVQEVKLKLETEQRLRADSLRNDSIKKADSVKRIALKKTSVKDSIAKKKADSLKARKLLKREQTKQKTKEVKLNNQGTQR